MPWHLKSLCLWSKLFSCAKLIETNMGFECSVNAGAASSTPKRFPRRCASIIRLTTTDADTSTSYSKNQANNNSFVLSWQRKTLGTNIVIPLETGDAAFAGGVVPFPEFLNYLFTVAFFQERSSQRVRDRSTAHTMAYLRVHKKALRIDDSTRIYVQHKYSS